LQNCIHRQEELDIAHCLQRHEMHGIADRGDVFIVYVQGYQNASVADMQLRNL